MKTYGTERFMGLIPLAVVVLVATVLAGGPGELITLLDRFVRQGWEILLGWVHAVTG